MTLPQNRKHAYTAITAATLLIACMTITDAASAQTFNPQQQPDFGNFNGSRPDFGGNWSFPGDFNGSNGFPFGGDFNGTFPGRGDGNFTRPDFSGAPNQYDANDAASPDAVSGSQTDYTLIVAAVIVVIGIIAVAVAVMTRKKKASKIVPPPPVGQEHFEF